MDAGTVVALLYGSANRDDAVFADPASFCPGRAQRATHLAFGHGIHARLGAALARMKARAALAVLTRRLPGLLTGRGLAARPGRQPQPAGTGHAAGDLAAHRQLTRW